MSVEKVLVDRFQILENKGQMGIELEIDEEPIRSASFLYDGRNCAILIRNNAKAFILTNIAYELRQKLLLSDAVLILETKGEDIITAYPVNVHKIGEIPFPDEFDNVLSEILYQIKDKYGDKAVDLMIAKFWPENKK